MKIYRKKDKNPVLLQNQEYVANMYVMRCFTVAMTVYFLTFILNQAGVFIIEKELMWKAFLPSAIIYIIARLVSKKMPPTDMRTKYIILFCTVVMFTVTGVYLTYHATLLLSLPFLYATLYSSKRVMRYVFDLSIVSSIISVYCGYYFGLCDANMVLLTARSMKKYVIDGLFVSIQANPNPIISLALFYVLPRCLISIAIMFVCNSIVEIISGSREKKEQMFLQTVTALSEAVDAKDRYTSGHSKRVAEYAKRIAKRLGKNLEDQDEVYRAGLLHDVGKIRIPEEIINKPGRLTDEEFSIIKIHPVTGYNILKGISEDSIIATAAKHHHERYDGKGYPNGLKGEEIPETARILAVADAYDAMASNRSYRKALPQNVVREEIEKGRGTQFDPKFADIMLKMIDEDMNYRMKETESGQRRVLTVDNKVENNMRIMQIMQDDPRYEVVFASGTEEAKALLSEKVFDLILLDVALPGENTQEAFRQMKETYNTPIILIVGEKTTEMIEAFTALGCDDYLTKPVQPLLLKESLHNLTERTNL